MKIADREVDMTLLSNYVRVIHQMETLRSLSPHLYDQADKYREALHSEILKRAGTDREDQKFAFELAQFVESF